MKMKVDLSRGSLVTDDVLFQVSCKVRSLRDSTRASSEVVRSMPDDLPYDPRTFPKGLWNVTGTEWQKDRKFDPDTFGTVKIRTDAWQMVNVWELDADGDYRRETDRKVRDSGYLLHYSAYKTTWGCIRMASREDAELLAKIVEAALKRGEAVQLEVA